jgi:hypothetical protein
MVPLQRVAINIVTKAPSKTLGKGSDIVGVED